MFGKKKKEVDLNKEQNASSSFSSMSYNAGGQQYTDMYQRPQPNMSNSNNQFQNNPNSGQGQGNYNGYSNNAHPNNNSPFSSNPNPGVPYNENPNMNNYPAFNSSTRVEANKKAQKEAKKLLKKSKPLDGKHTLKVIYVWLLLLIVLGLLAYAAYSIVKLI